METRERKNKSNGRSKKDDPATIVMEPTDGVENPLVIPKFPGVNIRKEPDMHSGVIGVLTRNMSVECLENRTIFRKAFYKVRTDDGYVGFVRSDCVNLLG